MTRLNKSQMLMLEKGQFTCRDVEKLLGEYFDRELPLSLQSRVQDHFQSCEECRELAESYQMVIQLARELGEQRGTRVEATSPATMANESNATELPQDVKTRLAAHLKRTLGTELKL